MNRRLYGLLSKRLDEAELDDIQDPRDGRGKRWQLSTLLRSSGSVRARQTLPMRPERIRNAASVSYADSTSEKPPLPPKAGTTCAPLCACRHKPFDASNQLVSSEDRYLVSSLPRCRLTTDQWLLVVRRHWGVETSHQILDGAIAADDRPWISHNPRGALVVSILRRIAYTVLTLFRSVTQRSDERRRAPWKLLMLDVLTALLTTNEDQIRGLRFRASC
jgi:hypothetical protein